MLRTRSGTQFTGPPIQNVSPKSTPIPRCFPHPKVYVSEAKRTFYVYKYVLVRCAIHHLLLQERTTLFVISASTNLHKIAVRANSKAACVQAIFQYVSNQANFPKGVFFQARFLLRPPARIRLEFGEPLPTEQHLDKISVVYFLLIPTT